MNDASGEHIEEHAAALESSKQLPRRIENDEAHFDPSRWWFASSAFPMIAGTLGPVASAFSVCALVRPWRQSFPPGSDITKATYINDPVWLIAINAIQLGIALGANLMLLLNMARRLRFAIAQPLTIIGWYLSSLCLVALTATGVGPLEVQPVDQYVWSQAFYYGIYAAILYFIVASLMVVTFHGAYVGHYAKDFELTTSQRTLMLQTILFLMYLLLGALFFSNIEGWQYLDAVYWADVTLFTVGFGDLYPMTAVGRALLFPYALIGIISLGLVIGSIRSLMLERGRRRLHARMVEKKRRKLIRQLTKQGWEDLLVPIEERPREQSTIGQGQGWGDPMVPNEERSKEKSTIGQGQGWGDPAAIEERSKEQSTTGHDTRHESHHGRPTTGHGTRLPRTEFQRREMEFKLMRKIQEDAEKRRKWIALGVSTGTWVVLWLLGAKIFQECEAKYQSWGYFDGVYFAFVSLTTIGYGDVTPVSNAGKSFFVFWSLMALPTMTVLISNAGDTVVKAVRDGTNLLGNVTILPGESGFKKDWKKILQSLSFGKVFNDDFMIEESPPGFLGDAETHDASDSEDLEQDRQEIEREHEEMKAEEAAALRSKGVHQDLESSPGGNDHISNGGSETATTPTHQRHGRLITFMDEPKPHRRATSARSSVDSPRLMTHHANLSSQMVAMSRAVSIPQPSMPEIPQNKADYLVMLIEEIGHVMQHLKSRPPRKYDFQEWAFYLKLIGEDESNAETHRHVRPHQHHKKDKARSCNGGEKSCDEDPEHNRETKADNDGQFQWSWVGTRSPLMGSQEEAEWILEKLTKKLAQELRKSRDGEKHS